MAKIKHRPQETAGSNPKKIGSRAPAGKPLPVKQRQNSEQQKRPARTSQPIRQSRRIEKPDPVRVIIEVDGLRLLSVEYHSPDIARILADRASLARLSEDNGPLRLQYEHTRGEGSYSVRTNMIGRATCDGRPIELSIPIRALIESEIGKKPLATEVIELASAYFSKNLGEVLYVAIYELLSEGLMDALEKRPNRKFGEFGRRLTKIRQEIRRGTPGFFAKGIDVGDTIRKIVAGFSDTSQRPTKRRVIRALASHSKWRGPTGNEFEVWLRSEAAITFLDFHLKKSFDCNWQSFLDTHLGQTT